MLSTMAQSPLTVAQILRYAVDEHGDWSVTTATGEGYRKITYSELGNQASRVYADDHSSVSIMHG